MSEPEDDDQSERDYERGHRAAWTSLLEQAMTQLGMRGRTLEALISERERAVAALREVCEAHGDNDWDENLFLSDVIEKHLGRHLDD